MHTSAPPQATKASSTATAVLPDGIPAELADVALLSIGALVAASGSCRSAVYRELAAGDGPTAIRFGSRCVRFRLIDVRAWLIERAARAEANGQANAAAVRARATAASHAARSKRMAAAAGSVPAAGA